MATSLLLDIWVVSYSVMRILRETSLASHDIKIVGIRCLRSECCCTNNRIHIVTRRTVQTWIGFELRALSGRARSLSRRKRSKRKKRKNESITAVRWERRFFIAVILLAGLDTGTKAYKSKVWLARQLCGRRLDSHQHCRRVILECQIWSGHALFRKCLQRQAECLRSTFPGFQHQSLRCKVKAFWY